jgi:hypothetical protein
MLFMASLSAHRSSRVRGRLLRPDFRPHMSFLAGLFPRRKLLDIFGSKDPLIDSIAPPTRYGYKGQSAVIYELKNTSCAHA